KNAWTFAILKLPQNLIIFAVIFAVNAIVFWVMFLYLPTFVYLLFLGLFLTGFTAFTANYYIWHVMDKYIVSLVKPKNNDAIFNDDEYPETDDDYDEEVEIEDEYLL
ncbi:MAG: hypothetical protein J6R66_05940, partial [Clostridia bacterium]|nr:hypothetical protein [Clostridia bacterium]